MSINENDFIYNSSINEGEIEAILIPSSLPSNSSQPLPVMIRQSIISSQSHQQHEKNFGEVGFVGSPEEPELELGLDLGRRLARLELGNEINNEKLDRIKQLSQINQETLVLENSRIHDLEGKVISMEARLLSEVKQGFDTKEKLENLVNNLKIKNKEILVLREIINDQMTKQATQEKKCCTLEKGNCELTSQFVTLLETCEAFNDELLSLKKMNFELKKELYKKGNTSMSTASSETSPSKIIPITGSHPTHSMPNYPTRAIHKSHQISSRDLYLASISGRQEGTEETEATAKVDCVTPKSKQMSYYGQEFVPQGYPNFYYSASEPIDSASSGAVYSASGDIYSAQNGSVPTEHIYSASSGAVYSAPSEPIYSASSGAVYSVSNEHIYSASSGSVSYPQPNQEVEDTKSKVIFETGPAFQGADLEAVQDSINSHFNGYYYQ